MTKLSHRLDNATKDSLAHFLIRACFDFGVRSDRLAHGSIETCLSNLFDTYAPGDELDEALEKISRAVFGSIHLPTLRQQFIDSLPVSTPRMHLFRRSLALAFALGKERHLNAVLTNTALTGRLLLLFDKGSALRVKKDTDYVELRARLSMLDTALDVGFSDFAFLESSDKKAEKQFNDSIDQLADSVRQLSARIMDAGAAHMTRTEAKVVAERVVQRLEFAVRTKEKPPKDWFGEQEKQEEKEFMSGWAGTKNGAGEHLLVHVELKPTEDAGEGAQRVDLDALTPRKDVVQAKVPDGLKSPGLMQSPLRKVVIRGGSASPMAKKARDSMMSMP